MKLTPGLLICLSAGSVLAGDGPPAEQVQNAVRNLAASPGYSWVVTARSGDNSRFTPGPVEGQTEKNGCIRWVMSFGDHKSEAFVKGDRVAVKSGDSWVKPEQMTPPPPPGPPPGSPPPGPPPSPPGGESRPSPLPVGSPSAPPPPRPGKGPESARHHDGRRTSFLARRLQEMKAPADFAAELLGKVSTVTAAGDGSFKAELPADAVKELLAFGKRSRGGRDRGDAGRDREKDQDKERSDRGRDFAPPAPPEPRDTGGSVTFSVRDGMLARMELELTATVSFNGTEMKIDRTTQFEIKDAGTTRLEIPAAARAILEAPAP